MYSFVLEAVKFFQQTHQSPAHGTARRFPQGMLAALTKPLVLGEFQTVPSLLGAIEMISDSAIGQKFAEYAKKSFFMACSSIQVTRSSRSKSTIEYFMPSRYHLSSDGWMSKISSVYCHRNSVYTVTETPSGNLCRSA